LRANREETADPSTTLRSPGFPVEFGGVGALYAAFLNESSTRGNVQRRVAGNPGPVGMTNLLQGMVRAPSPANGREWLNKFVIPTGAQRSGGICGFFSSILIGPKERRNEVRGTH
jgi:hypothetical protein